jgi:SprT protein
MNVPVQLQKKIASEVERYVNLARKQYKKEFIVPRIMYTLRGTCAGYAQGVSQVNFNSVLLMENQEDFLKSTVPHEVAHCIDSAMGGNQSFGITFRGGRVRRARRSVHGESWKAIMRLFGADPNGRTHNYDTSRAQVRVKRKYEYQCTKCGHTVTMSSVAHNRIVRGATYWHKACGRTGTLVFVKALGQVTRQELQELQELQERRAAQEPSTKEVPVHTILNPTGNVAIAKLINEVPAHRILKPTGNVAIAKRIMEEHGYGLTRQQFIDHAVKAGVKATTASTYYYNQLRNKV